MAGARTKRQAPEASEQEARGALPLSITHDAILLDGTDREFRRLIHRMLIGSARLSAVRDSIAERIGVSGTQYTMLMSVLHLQGDDGISIGALADYLEVTGPHVTGVVGELVKQGLLRKAVNPRDRRGVLVRLSPLGRRRLLQTFDFISSVNDRLFEGVNREEYQTVANFNARFIRNTQATLAWIDRQADGARPEPEIE